MQSLGGLFPARFHVGAPVKSFLSLACAVLCFAPEICDTTLATDASTFETPWSAPALFLAIREVF